MSEQTPFCCPVCGQALAREENSLRCPARHCFDLARQGYVNLLRKAPETLYENKDLFQARRGVYQAGFFDPVISAVRSRLTDGLLLDAGCGEGSLLAALSDCARPCVGLDISRTAIRMAATRWRDLHFCVADLCALPLVDGAAGCIVNMLTPANYAEFARVLAPGGRLIKLIPNAGHLRQIRALTGKTAEDGEARETRNLFSGRFRLTEEATIRYDVNCDAALAAQVFRMTPLTAHETAPDIGAMTITVDLTLLCGEP